MEEYIAGLFSGILVALGVYLMYRLADNE